MTQHETRILDLRLTGDQQALLASLDSLSEHPVVAPEPGRFQVTIPEDMVLSRVYAAIQTVDGVVREFREHRRSLEEVFLGAVRSAERARDNGGGAAVDPGDAGEVSP